MEPGSQWCNPESHFDTRTFILADIVDDSVTIGTRQAQCGTHHALSHVMWMGWLKMYLNLLLTTTTPVLRPGYPLQRLLPTIFWIPRMVPTRSLGYSAQRSGPAAGSIPTRKLSMTGHTAPATDREFKRKDRLYFNKSAFVHTLLWKQSLVFEKRPWLFICVTGENNRSFHECHCHWINTNCGDVWPAVVS